MHQLKQIIGRLADIPRMIVTNGKVKGHIRTSTCGAGCMISSSAIVRNSCIEERIRLSEHCKVDNSRIGRYTYMESRSIATYADIGSFCSIAENVRVGATNHNINRVTTHEITYLRSHGFNHHDDDEFIRELEEQRVYVGNDVWIGYGAVILPRVKVGNGAIIGANSVVTKDVQPYSIVAGNPAKHLRFRFNKNVIEKLEKIYWFDWADEKIKQHISQFNNVEDFIRFHET